MTRRPAALLPLVALPGILLAILLGTLLVPAPAIALADLDDRAPVPVGEGAWPLQPRPRVVAGFDPPAERWGRGHRGVDLSGRPGAPVRSALAGTVAWVGTIASVPSVSVQHGPLRTTYQPVTTDLVVGEPVARGQSIGRLVRAGSHCFPGACLHWGLKHGEDYLDPLLLVGGGPVRLLPLDGTGPTTTRGHAALAVLPRGVV